MNTPKQHQLQESAAGEEDPGSGLDASDSAIKPEGSAPSANPAKALPARKPVDEKPPRTTR